jgi:hypothetical protein
MEYAPSYMFGGGDAACWIRDGGVMSAAAGAVRTKNVSSDSRMKNNACEVAIIVICFGGQSSNMSLI